MWDQSTSLNSNERQPLLGGGPPSSRVAAGGPPIGTQSQVTNRAVSNLVNLLTGLVNQVKELEQSVQLIGTPRETTGLKSLASSQKRDVEASLRSAQQALVEGRNVLDAKTYNRIENDLNKVASHCNRVFALFGEKTRIAGGFDEGYNNRSNEEYSHVNQQQLLSGLRLIEEEDVDQKILRENREGISQIAEDLVVLKELFSDVQQLVGEQGEVLIKVEANTTEANYQTLQAVQELKEASSLMDNIRKRKIYLYLCVIATLVIVGAAIGIYYAIKHKDDS
eukprot:TRINITY_DN1435_c0_g1_i1.p1 TRINITY_DN1435_c0_g1~~TRINITY_DN1435_c0_g1_i1.p1  ORF type:complete len:280 (-),score=86.15 TRINITY_DN1435_c0_g1_i1:160-999(-)